MLIEVSLLKNGLLRDRDVGQLLIFDRKNSQIADTENLHYRHDLCPPSVRK
jgi:hypothetical protein